MNAVRFAWLGESRRTALCTLVRTEVTGWSQDWWMQHADADVDVHLVDHHGFVTKDHAPYVSQTAGGSLALFTGGRGLEGLGHHLAGTMDEDGAGWARRIGEDALEDLAAHIFRRAGISDYPALDQRRASDALGRADLGSCILTIGVGRFGFNLALDRLLADRLAPPASPARIELTSRQAALAKVPARMDAMMDFGSVSLTQLADLRVGEILVGDLGLEETLKVCIDGRDIVAKGHLRRIGEKRAVMLDGLNSQEDYKS